MQQGSILRFLTKGGPSGSRSDSARPGQPYQPRPDADSRSTPTYGRRGRGAHGRGSRGSGRGQHRGPNRRRNDDLKLVADETKAELPKILDVLPAFDAANSSRHDLEDTKALDPLACPGHVLPPGDACAGQKGTRIQVYDMDTLDAALQLAPDYKVHTHLRLPKPVDAFPSVASTASTSLADAIQPKEDSAASTADNANLDNDTPMQDNNTPVLVLNLASERTPGGGWSNGALAQEECLCYRSSLSLSLHSTYYPLPSLTAIYTPSVLLLRSSLSTAHKLLTPHTTPPNLPVVSVLSLAALRKPPLTPDATHFKHESLRTETKHKIRLALRVAAVMGHTKLVLGALGCGVFANPPGDVARCFLEVLRETEFQGGWWQEVAFAVLDNVKGGEEGGKEGKGNFGVFYRGLHGKVV